MERIANLGGVVAAYFSPGNNARPGSPPRKGRALSPKPILSMHLDRRSMSPTVRTADWLQKSATTSPAKDAGRRVVEGRITKGAPLTPPSSRLRSPAKDGEEEVMDTAELEGDTVVVDELASDLVDASLDGATFVGDEPVALETTKTSVSRKRKARDESRSPEPEEVDGEVERPIFNLEAERRKRHEALRQIADGDWTEAEVALYRRLTMRGFEPLLPRHWMMDYKTMPDVLFGGPAEQTFLNAASRNDFRAQKALSGLLALGASVRSMRASGKTPEALIKRAMEQYIRWSERDGQYGKKDFIPLITIAAPPPTAKPLPPKALADVLEAAISRKLSLLAARHRAALMIPSPSEPGTPAAQTSSRASTPSETTFVRPPPTLYGILISRSVVALVTADAARLESPMRTMALLDFFEAGQDVWNAFAVALLVVGVRDRLRAEDVEGRLGEERREVSEDPDI
ncbi:MAG: hypothetical protein M1832_000536 [Thelocarpon impressellum]|nr:MAG: hypothetical protein M1832_000536 [Thelocarpon impressellum]